MRPLPPRLGTKAGSRSFWRFNCSVKIEMLLSAGLRELSVLQPN
jgi:hypothetical protein